VGTRTGEHRWGLSYPSRAGHNAQTILVLGLIGLAGVTLAIIYAAAHAGHALAGLPPAPVDPWAVLFGVLGGKVAWPLASTEVAIGLAVVVVGGTIAIAIARHRRRARLSRVDPSAQHMGRGKDIASLRRTAAAATAVRLGVTGAPGILIGRTVLPPHDELYGGWEDMHLDIWAPRTGKTTSRVIPAVVDAPGAVLTTSNRRDVVDATRDVRAAGGDVWVFDPHTRHRKKHLHAGLGSLRRYRSGAALPRSAG